MRVKREVVEDAGDGGTEDILLAAATQAAASRVHRCRVVSAAGADAGRERAASPARLPNESKKDCILLNS